MKMIRHHAIGMDREPVRDGMSAQNLTSHSAFFESANTGRLRAQHSVTKYED